MANDAVPMAPAKDWRAIAQRAQENREASIAAIQPPLPDLPSELPLDVTGLPKEFLTEHELFITESPTEEIIEFLARGQLTAMTVTNAFLRRAALAQKLTNCITDLLPEQALSRAKELDEYYAANRAPIGPLHGLPISVKEHIGMKGLNMNAGFVAWYDNIASKDAHVLEILWNAGAVFYARTTQPQTVMHLETANNLYGTTVNPYNRNLSAGGSSGGEGALLGLKGSCLGIGSDIGGSVRSPAAANGMYALRPTSLRIPMMGSISSNASEDYMGQDFITAVLGPMSTSLGGLKLFMRTVLASKPWLKDPSLMPIPWKITETVFPAQRLLKVGVMWSDGVVNPHPPVTRALREVTTKLQNIWGVTLVDWQPYKHEEAWQIAASLYFADGGDEEKQAIAESGEPSLPLTKWIIQENKWVKRLSIEELWKWRIKREEYGVEHARQWNDLDVDVLLCPVGPGVAPLLNTAKWWGYTSLWNLLDYPAVVFPVSKVDTEIDVMPDGYEPIGKRDRYNAELYSPEKFKGAPVSLQLVARRYEDEKLLGVLQMIQDALDLPFA